MPLAEDLAGAITLAGFAELKYLPLPGFDEKNEYERRPAARGGSRRESLDIGCVEER